MYDCCEGVVCGVCGEGVVVCVVGCVVVVG